MRRSRVFWPAQLFLRKGVALLSAILLYATAGAAQAKPAGEPSELPWAQELNKYPGLTTELGQLFAKLKENVRPPEPRSESRLLPLLPESATFFVAFPNYGDTFHQTLEVFHQELRQSEPLRNWWNGKLATSGPKIEDFFDKFYQVNQYLGDEIVVYGTLNRVVPELFALAEVRKPGFKKLLEQMILQLGGEDKAGIRVLDPQGLAITKDKFPSGLTVVVLPQYVIAGKDVDVAMLRSLTATLEGHSGTFTSTPFGQRVMQEYRDGLTILAAADLQSILDHMPPSTKQDPGLQRSGFADVKYAVWTHKGQVFEGYSQAELRFTGPRRGSAAWLANSVPLPSLDFVSPSAMMAAAIQFKDPASIFDEIKQFAGPSSNQFAAIAGGEKALNLNLRDDLLATLGGEFAVELDTVAPPKRAWRAMFSVRDAAHLQHTLGALLGGLHLQVNQVEEDGVAYQTLHIPSNPNPVDISYAIANGYLLIGSSQQAVADSIRSHRSGASLAKSAKFQASQPPGHSLDASALLYSDPVAMAALQMQRLSPEFATTLAKLKGDLSPSVTCLYGEDSAIREAGSKGAMDIGAALLVAAVAIPNLLRSRVAANEATAIGSLRTMNTAEFTYSSMYPQRGFAPNLAALGPDPRGTGAYSPDHAGLLDPTLGSAGCTGLAWCIKSGYRFRVTSLCSQHPCKEYVVVAIPVDTNTGTRRFCSASDGIIRWKIGDAMVPLNVVGCKSWPPIP